MHGEHNNFGGKINSERGFVQNTGRHCLIEWQKEGRNRLDAFFARLNTHFVSTQHPHSLSKAIFV